MCNKHTIIDFFSHCNQWGHAVIDDWWSFVEGVPNQKRNFLQRAVVLEGIMNWTYRIVLVKTPTLTLLKQLIILLYYLKVYESSGALTLEAVILYHHCFVIGDTNACNHHSKLSSWDIMSNFVNTLKLAGYTQWLLGLYDQLFTVGYCAKCVSTLNMIRTTKRASVHFPSSSYVVFVVLRQCVYICI